jgi:hypothetical protein
MTIHYSLSLPFYFMGFQSLLFTVIEEMIRPWPVIWIKGGQRDGYYNGGFFERRAIMTTRPIIFVIQLTMAKSEFRMRA